MLFLFLGVFPYVSSAQYYELHPRSEFLDSVLLTRVSAMEEYLAHGSCDSRTLFDTFYFENGHILAHGKCIDGRMAGYWKSFYPNGQPRAEGIIKDQKPYSFWTFYHPNGQKKAFGKFTYIEAGLGCGGSYRGVYFEGTWKFWDSESHQTETVSFSEGTVHGKYQRYYPNRNLFCEGLYFNGVFNGLWTYYHPNGRKKREVYYRYDHETMEAVAKGTWREWDASGNLINVTTH